MIKMESFCVGCTPDLPCLGAGCPYHHPYAVPYCDLCGEQASCNIDGTDYCEDCAKDRLLEWFKDLSAHEQAEILDVYYKEYE